MVWPPSFATEVCGEPLMRSSVARTGAKQFCRWRFALRSRGADFCVLIASVRPGHRGSPTSGTDPLITQARRRFGCYPSAGAVVHSDRRTIASRQSLD